MSKQLYPRQRRMSKDKSQRRWHVDYDLIYDGGGSAWTSYYRTRVGAHICAFFFVHISSWGGLVILRDSYRMKMKGKHYARTL